MPDYIYKNITYSQRQVEAAALKSGLSLQEYIKKHGLAEKEDPKNVNWFNQTWFGRGYDVGFF